MPIALCECEKAKWAQVQQLQRRVPPATRAAPAAAVAEVPPAATSSIVVPGSNSRMNVFLPPLPESPLAPMMTGGDGPSRCPPLPSGRNTLHKPRLCVTQGTLDLQPKDWISHVHAPRALFARCLLARVVEISPMPGSIQAARSTLQFPPDSSPTARASTARPVTASLLFRGLSLV